MSARPVPEISVVMPAYGRERELALALDALSAQRLERERYEVIVVDDGSPSSLAPVVEARRGDLPLRHVRQEPNRGRAAARNRGAAEARGPVLLFLDADMIACPALLEAHLAAHRRAPAGSLVVLGPIPVAAGYESALGRYMERRGHMKPGVDDEAVPHRYFVSANTSVPRARFDEVGGYDERYVHYGGEDIDLGWKLGRAGSRIVVARDAVAHHAYRYDIAAGAARMREFGRVTLPLVLERHPELAAVFHLDLLTSRGPLAAGVFRMASAPPLLAAASLAARAGLARMAPAILSYVLVGNYFRGYLEHLAAPGGTVMAARS